MILHGGISGLGARKLSEGKGLATWLSRMTFALALALASSYFLQKSHASDFLETDS